MVTGENAGTWGTKTNTNLNLLQQAIAGYQAISIAGGAQTTALTMDNATISNARNAVIELTGTITGNQVVTIPNGIEKTYIIFNNTVGAFTVQFKTASGTGYTFATTDKTTRIFYSNGTNIIDSLLVNTAGIDTLTNKTLTSPRIGTSILDTNGNELALLTATASAVNEITLANSATGASPTISATGGDTNIGINLTPKGTGGIVLGAGAVGTPALTTSGDLNTGIYFPAADTIAFTEGGAEAMRIDSSGNVGINSTPKAYLQPNYKAIDISSGRSALMCSTGTPQTNLLTNAYYVSGGFLYSNTGYGATNYVGQDSEHKWYTAPSGTADASLTFTERMRITSSGDLFIGATSLSGTTAGVQIESNGLGKFHRSSFYALAANRLTDDGTLINLQQEGVAEGTISVSGATVSYNGFTGSHWSRFIDESKPDVLRGTIMESLDQMNDWYAVEFETSYTEKDADGNDIVKTHTEHKPYALKANEQEGDVITYAWNTEKKDEDDNDIIEQVQATIVKEKDVKHVMSKISDTSEAKNVYGVFSHWDNDDLINNDFYVASVGSYVVRIKAGQTVSKGDLLQSNGDGTAKVQADDLVRASSFAKVLSNTVIDTYEDGSFIVPCSLMC
jgi:hypothetical protein